MSEKLKATLLRLVDDERRRIEGGLNSYRDILIRSVEPEGYLLTIIVEGVDSQETSQTRRLIDDLCKVGLVSTDIHYTHRNAQLVARATPLGTEVVGELKRNK